MAASDPIPEGYALQTRRSPATRAWEPIHFRIVDGSYQLAIRFGAAHANTRGGLHGGVIATLCDNAMGLTVALAGPGESPGFVTTSLAVDYISAARQGQWVVVAPRLIKRGKTSGVVDALVYADDVVVARANATFRLSR